MYKWVKTEEIAEGEISFNGHKFSAAEAAAYNRHTADVKRAVHFGGATPSPLSVCEIERALNSRHSLFCMITGMV